MKENLLVLSSSVSTTLKKSMLFRGTVLAGSGAFILLLSAIFLSLAEMKIWGLFILILSGSLITFGLIPYRKLSRLELNPDKLILENDNVHYIHKGKRVLTIPFQEIEQIEFCQKSFVYGIGIKLKYSLEKQKKFGCDLFFPYFTKRSYESWMEFQKSY